MYFILSKSGCLQNAEWMQDSALKGELVSCLIFIVRCQHPGCLSSFLCWFSAFMFGCKKEKIHISNTFMHIWHLESNIQKVQRQKWKWFKEHGCNYSCFPLEEVSLQSLTSVRHHISTVCHGGAHWLIITQKHIRNTKQVTRHALTTTSIPF